MRLLTAGTDYCSCWIIECDVSKYIFAIIYFQILSSVIPQGICRTKHFVSAYQRSSQWEALENGQINCFWYGPMWQMLWHRVPAKHVFCLQQLTRQQTCSNCVNSIQKHRTASWNKVMCILLSTFSNFRIPYLIYLLSSNTLQRVKQPRQPTAACLRPGRFRNQTIITDRTYKSIKFWKLGNRTRRGYCSTLTLQLYWHFKSWMPYQSRRGYYSSQAERHSRRFTLRAHVRIFFRFTFLLKCS